MNIQNSQFLNVGTQENIRLVQNSLYTYSKLLKKDFKWGDLFGGIF